MEITKRIDAVTLIPKEYLAATPPAPRSVKIELTARCNYQCSFCALRTRVEKPQDIDIHLFKRITLEMAAYGVEEIGVFYLGESFCSPDLLLEAVTYLKADLGLPYVFLTTNGSLAETRIVESLMATGLDSLKWSINAATDEQFAKIMQVKPGLFHKALDHLRQAREIRDRHQFRTRIYASSIRYDGDQQRQMEQLLQEHVLPYVDRHYWLPLYSMGSVATQREEELGYRPIAGNQGRNGALREPLPCWSTLTEGHVTMSGKLSACCFDASGAWEMADLNKVSFMEGWHSEKFQEL